MAATTEELLQMILQSLEKVEYIKSEDIPNIDLYMDQVLTFMDRKLRSAVRPQTEDRILTKTMINNYAKNDLLPPPVPVWPLAPVRHNPTEICRHRDAQVFSHKDSEKL